MKTLIVSSFLFCSALVTFAGFLSDSASFGTASASSTMSGDGVFNVWTDGGGIKHTNGFGSHGSLWGHDYQGNFYSFSTNGYMAYSNANSGVTLRMFTTASSSVWQTIGGGVIKSATLDTNGNLSANLPAASLTGNIPLPALTNVFNGTTAVNGGGMTNLNASQLTSGTNVASVGFGTIAVGTNLIVTSANTTIQNGSPNTLVITNGNVGIGTRGPGISLSVVAPAVNGTREQIIFASVSDASTGSFVIGNGTAADATFVPTFAGRASNTNNSLLFRGLSYSANDTGAIPVVSFQVALNDGDIYNGTFSSVATRPAFGFQNNSTYLMTILNNGNVGIGTTSPAAQLVVATNIIAGGTITATNGFVSYSSNKLALASITFPATTATWTNTTGNNIFVFIDNTGVTGTSLSINGTQVFGLTLPIDVTIPLQRGEYFSEAYTVGTPTATWKPF